MKSLLYHLRSGYRRCYASLAVMYVIAALTSGLLLSPVANVLAEEVSEGEYKLKAALLYKLSRFVVWPADGKHASNVELFCVQENDPFGKHLEALQEIMPNKRVIKVSYLPNDGAGSKACQLAFTGKSADTSFQHSLEVLVGYSTLTVSDVRGFAKAGGMIEIVRRNKRLGFIINMQAVNQSGLRIAAPLLQMSTLINTEKKP